MSRAVRKGAPAGGLVAKLGIWARCIVTGGMARMSWRTDAEARQ